MPELKTNLTQSQLDQLAKLITFEEDEDGVLYIKDVLCSVEGDVYGNVATSVAMSEAASEVTSRAMSGAASRAMSKEMSTVMFLVTYTE